jgi:type III secretion system FlhB-like substrate exporter
MDKKRVVGISCDPTEGGPVVVVKGAGEAADAILENARQQENLPVVRDAPLVNQLYRVPIDGAVGRDLFPVMAVLLAHLLCVDRKTKEQCQ